MSISALASSSPDASMTMTHTATVVSILQEFIDHVLSCPCTKGTKKQRHDLLLPILEALFKQLGYEWDTPSDGYGFSDVIQAVPGQGSGRLQGDKKLDAVAHWMADRTKSWGIAMSLCIMHALNLLAKPKLLAGLMRTSQDKQRRPRCESTKTHVLIVE